MCMCACLCMLILWQEEPLLHSDKKKNKSTQKMIITISKLEAN